MPEVGLESAGKNGCRSSGLEHCKPAKWYQRASGGRGKSHLLINPLLLRLLNTLDRIIHNGLFFPPLVNDRVHAPPNRIVDAARNRRSFSVSPTRPMKWLERVTGQTKSVAKKKHTGSCSFCLTVSKMSYPITHTHARNDSSNHGGLQRTKGRGA